jgi:hypothetical protein
MLSQTEQDELDALELEALEAEAAATEQAGTDLPRPDTTTGPTNRMDPFARTGYLMSTPKGQEAMALTADTIKNMGLEGGGAAVGQMAGAATGPLAPAAVPALGAVGAGLGNIAAQLTTPGKNFSLGELGGAIVGGTIPGGSVAKAGGTALLKEGAKQAAGNLAATAVQTGIESQRLPTAGEAAMSVGGAFLGTGASKIAGNRFLDAPDPIDAKRNQVLTAWRAAGGKIDPEAVNKGIPLVGMMAGKEGTRQAASVDNQKVINRLIREDLGLKAGKPITTDTLDLVREEAGIAYQRIANLSKQAASDLENLKQARFNARELGEAYKTTGNPEALTKWKQARATADMIETLVEDHAVKSGRPQLVKDLKKARELYAKSFDAEAALSPGSGYIDASVLASAYDGKNMTGNLKLVAEAAQNFPQYLTEKSRVGAPGVSRLGVYSGANAMAQGGPAGAAAFTLPLLGKPARKFILGDVVQNYAANQSAKQAEKVSAAMARLSLLSAGRNNMFLPQPVNEQP